MISELRQQREDAQLLLELRQMERLRQKEKDMWADVSHEIRNNTNVIVGISSALAEMNMQPEQQKMIEQLDYASNCLLALVNDFLELTVLQNEQYELKLEPLNLRNLADTLKGILEFRLQGKPVHVRFYYDPDIPEFLLVDKRVLHQILLNLLGNAVKFTDRGHVAFEVRLERQTLREASLAFHVMDTGSGIPAERLDGIFERFARGGAAETGQVKGTGLGLPIARELAELHGGGIEVESAPGEGTTFTVRLAFQRAPAPTTTSRTLQPAAGRRAGGETMRALIVEDSPMNRVYLDNILGAWGFSCVSCETGSQALAHFERESFDLILLDLHLNASEMNGYETAICLRNAPEYARRPVPIVAIAGAAEIDVREKLQSVGIAHFLSKPFKPEALFEKILTLSKTFLRNDRPAYRFSKVFDVETLHELYRQDYRHIQLMFETFLRNTPQIVLRMEENLQRENWSAFEMDAHKIKPTFAMIGAPDLGKQAGELETVCRSEPVREQVLTAFVRFKGALEEILEAVRREVQQLSAFNLTNG